MILSTHKSGSRVRIKKINSGESLFNRLASMGIVEGSEVEVVSNTGRGPILLELAGRRFAIGQGMAEKIEVS